MDRYQRAAEMVLAIEAEMNRIGLWSDESLPPEAYAFSRAFGMDTMTFPQWLQFIFIPRVNEIIQSRDPLPARSQVGTQAGREFDSDPRAATLVALLSEFDSLFNAPR